MPNLVTVEFRGDTLFAVEEAGGAFVAVKPICDRLGLSWSAQRERINRDDLLREDSRMMRLPSLGGAQDSLCLALRLINGWLFGIDVARVKPELREAVLAYKRECYEVLADRFLGPRVSADPIRIPEPGQDTEYRRRLDTVSEARRLYGAARARLLYERLDLPAVPELPELPIDDPEVIVSSIDRRMSDLIVEFIEKRQAWTGTCTQLLAFLNRAAPEVTRRHVGWPRTPRALSNALSRVAAPLLRPRGIELARSRSEFQRTVSLTLLRQPPRSGD